MTDELSIGLMKLLRKAQMADDADFLREGVPVFSEALMAREVTAHVGAERHARTPERTGQRNGSRERRWDTRVGTIDLHVPRVRDGSYFPALLDPRRRAERALVAVVQEAYLHAISTRRGDDLVQALVRFRDGARRWMAKWNGCAAVRSWVSIPISGLMRPPSRCGRMGGSSQWRS